VLGELDQREEEADEDAASKDNSDSDFVRLNSGFQADAHALLRPLLSGDQIDFPNLQTAFLSLKDAADAGQRDCAIALWNAIGARWESAEIAHGIHAFAEMLAEFLAAVEDQVDFLFWWQSACAKEKNNQMFTHSVAILVREGIIGNDGIAEWCSEQTDELTPSETAVFKAWDMTRNTGQVHDADGNH
jgi:hypothetical protein